MAPREVLRTNKTRYGEGKARIGQSKRRIILDEERKALRDHRRNNTPTPSYKDLIHWFSQQYDGYVLGKSTVGRSLSIEFDYLDAPVTQHVMKCTERGGEEWPELKDALCEWAQRHLEANETLDNAVLKAQAETFWSSLEAYKGKPIPQFSEAWLGYFNSREAIKQTVKHEEAALVFTDGVTPAQIPKVKKEDTDGRV